jgi:hypothetical protein
MQVTFTLYYSNVSRYGTSATSGKILYSYLQFNYFKLHDAEVKDTLIAA